MKKPTKITRAAVFDYIECRDYLQEKYEYNERDYAGHFTDKGFDSPYQDFWHWVIDACGVTQGGTVYFANDLIDSCDKPWQAEILEHYLVEFGEGPNRECAFLTDW